MDKKLLLKYIDESGNVVPFVDVDNQIEINEFKYESVRMAGAPTISFTLRYNQCLDNVWKETVFAEFNNERYYLSNTPSSSYDNTDARFVHDVRLVSERATLDAVYFYDVVGEDYEGDRPVSNSSKVTFHGTIHQFVERLNYSLQYAKLQTKNEDGTYSGYRVVVDSLDEEAATKDVLMVFEDQFISNVLQEIYNTYGLPYYFNGKEIHIGYASDVISTVFQYGIDDALLSIKKENSNNKIVNRCTATGSSENLPYYYPNQTPLGDIEVTTNREGIRAQIIDTTKFSNNSLLNNFVTYSELEGSPENDASYGYARINSESKWETYDKIMPFVELDNVKIQNGGVGIFSTVDATNRESGVKRVNVRFVFDISDLYGDAIWIEKYQDEIYTKISSVHVFIDEGEKAYPISNYELIVDEKTKQTRGVSINYSILASHKYRFEIYPIITNGKSDYVNVTATLKCNMQVTSQENDSYWVNYGWCDSENKVISLYNIGVNVEGTPKEGDTINFTLLGKIAPQSTLMPPIYRSSEGKERFYNAVNGKNGYVGYEFPNPYVEGKPKEHIAEFADIKPTITGMKNSQGQPIDKFLEFAYDEEDSNETQESEGNLIFKHPYFFAKLPKLDFNLFDHAIESGEMTISMTSGDCGACNFVIGVSTLSSGKQVNTVQVDDNGNLLRDSNGNVICGREHYQSPVEPQDRQNDTINNEVWIALKKEEATYGTLMPSFVPSVVASGNIISGTSIRPSIEDTFVITNIHLPQIYITTAEEKLKEAILKYMLENNSEKFNFSLKFSRIYLQENETILRQLNENARMQIRYNDKIYEQYVNSFTYNMGSDALPEISVNLVESLSVAENPIQTAVSEIGNMVASLFTNMDAVTQCLPYFLRKDVEDIAYKKITFQQGVEFGQYTEGTAGTGGAIKIDGNGNSIAEFDFLSVRKKAMFKELTIQELKNVGGELILSPAAMECSSITELEDVYRCYFEKQGETGEQIENEFVVGDQVRCQTFNLNGNRYYWRLVTAVGEDYIELSKDDCDANSDVPLAGDKIAVLGNRNDSARQAAIILSAYGENSPSMTQYAGIDSYSLVGKMVTKFSNGENVVTGTMKILPNSEGAANFTDLNVGNYNLLRNSGFTGDYLSEELTDERVLEAKSEMFSAPFDYWTVENAEVVASTEETPSQSGFVVEISDGSLEQTLYYDILPNEKYVFSLRGKSESNSEVSIEVGGTISTILLDGEWKRHSVVFETTSAEKNFKISCADCVICELQLERGTIASAWGNSYLDNSSDRAYWQSMRYMQDAISEASTTVNGGLVLTQLIQVGDYDKDTKEMVKTTGGVSGLYNDVDSNVAFWSGGDLAKAKNTVEYYKANGKEAQPTQEELAQMAKFVVTHGGLAILNDIILRGYVYADGGVFNGTVNATDGVFNGTVYANSGVFSGVLLKTKTIITAENKANFEIINHGFTYIDITKVGTFVECQTDCDFWFGGTIHIPEGTALNKEYIEEQLALVGNEVIICKSSDDINVTITGSTISKELVVIEDSLSDYQFKVVENYFGSSSVIRNANQFAYARCIITDKYNFTQSAIAWEWKVVNFN